MNCEQAKPIPLSELLHRLGHQPAKEIRGELWYSSPFRHEKEPSFKINPEKNVWFDFGHGEGGHVLDFIMTLYKRSEVKGALLQGEAIGGGPGQSSPVQSFPTGEAKEKFDSPQIQISKIQALQNKALIEYRLRRRIEKQTAAASVKEIYDRRNDKSDFALAFPNLSGGYELRNPYFKGVIGKKNISLRVKEKKREGTDKWVASSAVTICEGFMDFGSALTFYRVRESKTHVIVLNSVITQDRALEKVYLYLDPDPAGGLLLEPFDKHLGADIAMIDKSDMNKEYKDFNDFWVASQ